MAYRVLAAVQAAQRRRVPGVLAVAARVDLVLEPRDELGGRLTIRALARRPAASDRRAACESPSRRSRRSGDGRPDSMRTAPGRPTSAGRYGRRCSTD